RGLYSNHSPGRLGGASFDFTAWTSTPIICAVTALASEGAARSTSGTVTNSNNAATAADCHRKIVCENGITPVMSSSGFGRLAGLACNCAADELRPSAQVAPRPRQPAAPAAR